MFENKGIEDDVFTFHLSNANSDSWIVFGKPEGGFERFKWARLPPDASIWSLNILENNIPGIKSDGIYLDSGLSFILTPTADMSLITAFIKTKTPSCDYTNFMVQCKCTTATDLDVYFPEIVLLLGKAGDGSIRLTLKGSSYMTIN